MTQGQQQSCVQSSSDACRDADPLVFIHQSNCPNTAAPPQQKFDSQLLQGFELFKAPGPADAQPAPSILNDTDADASDGALHQMMNPRARAAAAPTDGTAAALVRARSSMPALASRRGRAHVPRV
jgi:hypothetical protein